MKALKRRRTKGMAVIELLVALAALSILTGIGLRVIAVYLEFHIRDAKSQVERRSIVGLKEHLGRAWQQRSAHSLNKNPWLSIDGKPDSRGLVLERFSIKTILDGSHLAEWTLEYTTDGWGIQIEPMDANGAQGQRIPLSYPGEIIVDTLAGEYLSSDGPELIRFQFPDANRLDLRQGFAIEALW